MTSINDLIKREVNPFDRINLKPMNFWADMQDTVFTVNSIHQEVIDEIEGILELVATDHNSRTVLLAGDSGSGKSHLLGRLKHNFNSKAFFAYILCNWTSSDYIWRYILRQTVDSLMQVPENQQDSQLLLWLKNLSAFTKRNIKQRIFDDNFWEALQSDRKNFIQYLKKTYKNLGIYNPDIFFGILHDLTNPELYDLACEWLRGDSLSEDSMTFLKVSQCIDNEDDAKKIMANFGKISTQTQPVVLCFENLETLPKLPDGFSDIQPLFDANTTIHGENFKNFLVIISVVTNTWKRHTGRIQQSDKAGIFRAIKLKRITLDQAEALWSMRLHSLHQQAQPKPESNIYPLTRQQLEQNSPGGRTLPRNAILLGRQKYQEYKESICNGNISSSSDKEETKAEFKLLWQKELKKIQEKIVKISLFSAPELIQMLQEALAALKVEEIKLKLLSGKYASYSLSYKQNNRREKIGVVWTEDSHMRAFFDVMNASKKAVDKNLCQSIKLIRAAGVGVPKLAGNKIYRQIFTGDRNHHIKPTLTSVHKLATYHSLVSSSLAHELVLSGKTVSVKELEALTRECKVLQDCRLLKDLGIVPDNDVEPEPEPEPDKPDLKSVENYLLNLVITQQFMGRVALVQNAQSQFSQVNESEINKLVDALCKKNHIQILDPNAPQKSQLVCLVPQSN
jgi:hypothetical protein